MNLRDKALRYINSRHDASDATDVVVIRELLSTIEQLEQVNAHAKALSESRLENIKAMSSYLDDVAEALGVPKPATPGEGIGACFKVMDALQGLGFRSAVGEHLAKSAHAVLSGVVDTPDKGYIDCPLRLEVDICKLIELEQSATKRAVSAEKGWQEALETIKALQPESV